MGRYSPKENEIPEEKPWYFKEGKEIHSTDEERFALQLAEGEGLLVADGSFKQGRSSAAVVIQHEKDKECPEAPTHCITTTVPGHPKEQSSYRGELGGILLGIVFANSVAKKYNITSGKCLFFSDNKGALAAGFGWKHPTPDWACFDLLSLIRYHLSISPIIWTHEHVLGHQDNSIEYQDLPVEAQANVIADIAAKKELQAFNTPVETWNTSHSHGQCWVVSCKGETINGILEERLRESTQEKIALDWWMRKFNVPFNLTGEIDVPTYKRFRTHTPRNRNTWAIKYAADLLPTKKNMTRRKHSEEHTCPSCGAANEDSDHLFQCRGAEMKRTFREKIDEIKAFLHSTTNAETMRGILTLVENLRHNRDFVEHPSTEVMCAVHKQYKIGLRGTLNGMWHIDWITIQKNVFRRTGSHCCPRVWLSNLSLLFQQMMFSLWTCRNEAIHNIESSTHNKHEHEKIDAIIKDIFAHLPNLRLLPQCDAAFFGRGEKRILSYRLQRKKKWASDAAEILESFRRSLDANAANFLDFFTNT